jgi:hypothetical protein
MICETFVRSQSILDVGAIRPYQAQRRYRVAPVRAAAVREQSTRRKGNNAAEKRSNSSSSSSSYFNVTGFPFPLGPITQRKTIRREVRV